VPDSPRNDPPTRVTLPRKAYVFASLFAVVQLGIFFLQLGLQEDQRSTGDRALEVAVTQLRESLPAIRAGGRLSEEALEDLPETRRLTERSLELTRTATPPGRPARSRAPCSPATSARRPARPAGWPRASPAPTSRASWPS
jgi:hypothetical protein